VAVIFTGDLEKMPVPDGSLVTAVAGAVDVGAFPGELVVP